MHDMTVPLNRISFEDLAMAQESFGEALVKGLSDRSKSIPCRFLYDAAGSALFDRICELPEYYPTRTELGILEAHAPQMARIMGPAAQLIELGSGSSQKVRLLLDAMERPAAYVPIDVSGEHLYAAAEALADEYPRVSVHAICADYAQPFPLPRQFGGGRRAAFFPGSTIGNLTTDEARSLMALWVERLGPDSGMLIGVDLKKDKAVLDAAYNDSQGVTAAFTKNILARANRELGGDFDLDAFAHDAAYSPEEGRMEIYLRSLAEQTAHAAGETFHFVEGERIHVEYSYKYDIKGFQALARSAGFAPTTVWTDPKALFSVHYLRTD